MSQLTQEDRNKIYEEEKLRREVQKQLEEEEKQQAAQKIADEKKKIADDKKKKSARSWKLFGILCLLLMAPVTWPLMVIGGVAYLLVKIGKLGKGAAVAYSVVAFLVIGMISGGLIKDAKEKQAKEQAKIAEQQHKQQQIEEAKVPASERIRKARAFISQVNVSSTDFTQQRTLLANAETELSKITKDKPQYRQVAAMRSRIKKLHSRIDKKATAFAKEQEKQQAKASSDLELVKSNWYQEYDFAIYEGQIKNISGSSLKNVQAVVSFYDKNGNFITSDSALIEYNPILPGQTSPFKVMGTWNPAMATASVEFKKLLGGTIATYEN